MEKVRFLIVGGGITNLAFASALRSRDLLVCEAQDDVGGYCRTVFRDGFTWDYSGHFFHFRHKDIEQLLVDRIGHDRVRTVEKRSNIWLPSGSIDFPFQKNIHQLPKADFIACLTGLFAAKSNTPPDNFLDMLYQKFGRGISDRFLVPYNEKLYATDLRKLDVDAMGRFFPHADPLEIVGHFAASNNTSYNATFTYPEGGAIEYVRALQQDVPESAIALGEAVLEIDLVNKLAHTSKRSIAFEHLVSAAPFPRLLKMCDIEYDPAVYGYNQVLVFNLGFDRKGPRNLHWTYFPQKELVFYRVGYYDNIFDSERMSLYVELGFPGGTQLTGEGITHYRDQVLRDLRHVGIVTDQQLVAWHHVVLDPAYVHITQDSTEAVAWWKSVLETRGVYSLGRYGSWTYCSIEDNILEARALAARFNALPC